MMCQIPICPQVFRGHVSHLENELAKVKTALSETTYQLEKLKTILGKASKTIQSSLQVYIHTLSILLRNN